jgi:3-oxoacyl-[acyl-carrier-protein] synthase-3
MNIKISAIEYYLPENVVNNEAMIKQFEFDTDFLENKLGIRERRRCNDTESCQSLCHEAAKKLIANQKIDLNSIGLLIVVTQNPDYKLPNVGSLLQFSLGLPDNVAAFDINLGCSGFVYALAVAKGFMKNANIQRALVVTGDPYSKIMKIDDRKTIPLFGDAATAVLLDRDSVAAIGEFDFGTDGSGADALIVRAGGSKCPRVHSNKDDQYLYMDGRAIYLFMMRRIPRSVEKCLALNGLSKDEIDFFVFHQASKYLLDSLKKQMKIPDSKMVYALETFGNTISSSIPIALKEITDNPANQGKRALLCGFGVGLSWASVVIRI